jgi:hypothetical protein
VAHTFGLVHQEPVFPIYGEFVAWAKEPDRWKGMSPAQRAEDAARLASATPAAEARRLQISIEAQAELARTDTGGSPSDWARLMQQLPGFEAGAGAAGTLVQRTLGWPLEINPGNRKSFSTFQGKGGSLPGVITEAWATQPAGGGPVTGTALFFRDLPTSVYQLLSTNFVHQELMQKLALDAGFRRDAQAALGS